MKRLSPGTPCSVGGKPGTVHGGTGSRDYIVRLNDGTRVIANFADIEFAGKNEMEQRTDPTHVPVITPSDTPDGDRPPNLPPKPLPPVVEDEDLDEDDE